MCYISLLIVNPKEKCYASWTQLFICLHWLENYIVILTLKGIKFPYSDMQTRLFHEYTQCILRLKIGRHRNLILLCLHYALKIVHASVSYYDYYHPLLYIRLLQHRKIDIELLRNRMILWKNLNYFAFRE